MITKERLENIKENVYMRSEIAKFSGLGIDTSLREELELIEEIDRLNNIIKQIEELCDKHELGKYDYSVPVFELKEVIKSEYRKHNK